MSSSERSRRDRVKRFKEDPEVSAADTALADERTAAPGEPASAGAGDGTEMAAGTVVGEGSSREPAGVAHMVGKGKKVAVTMRMVLELVDAVKAKRVSRVKEGSDGDGSSSSGGGSDDRGDGTSTAADFSAKMRAQLVGSCVHCLEASMFNCFGLAQLHQVQNNAAYYRIAGWHIA